MPCTHLCMDSMMRSSRYIYPGNPTSNLNSDPTPGVVVVVAAFILYDLAWTSLYSLSPQSMQQMISLLSCGFFVLSFFYCFLSFFQAHHSVWCPPSSGDLCRLGLSGTVQTGFKPALNVTVFLSRAPWSARRSRWLGSLLPFQIPRNMWELINVSCNCLLL